MNNARPDIPKKFASRVRAAQTKVEQERCSVIGTEQNIEGDRRWIGEFEADPETFARKHYRNHGVDSYPVTTTITRSRERLEYNIRRHPVRIKRLAEAERVLMTVEAEVLSEVAAMRPARGRVPWPKSLPTMGRFRELRDETDRQREEQDRHEREAWERKQAIEDERSRIERERQNDVAIAEYHRQFALLPTEEQARQREASAKIIAMVEAGELSKADLFKAVMKRFGP